jgi:protein kinase/serine/threonine-protein kinase
VTFLKKLITEIHRRSLWQVLGIYLAASWAALEAVDGLTEMAGLPEGLAPLAMALLILGLPFVLATAFVQEGHPLSRSGTGTAASEVGAAGSPSAHGPRSDVEPTSPGASVAPAAPSRTGVSSFFTWRNAVLSALGGAALWGVVATIWLVRIGASPAAGEAASADVVSATRASELALRVDRDLPAVAVLPFTNMSSDQEFAFFADGIHEDILANLSKLNDLLVLSRTSVLQYRDTEKTIGQIGDELGARAVLEGSVRRSGDQVRITAQLIEVESDAHLWAETYDRRLDDVFALQTEIAREVARALDATLTPAEERRIASVPTADMTAYDLYLEGRQAYGRYVEGENERAIRLFKDAIARDSTYALAWAGLSDAYAQYHLRWGGASEWADSAVAAGLRAVELDGESPEAHKALALSYRRQGLQELAIEHYQRALEVDPNFALAAASLGVVYSDLGQEDEAVRWYRMALRLDPETAFATTNLALTYATLSLFDRALQLVDDDRRRRGETPENLFARGAVHYALGETDSVMAQSARRVAMEPSDVPYLVWSAAEAVWAGDLDRAESLARDAMRLRPAFGLTYKSPELVLGEVAMARGDTTAARAHLEENLQRLMDLADSSPVPVSGFQIGMTHALLGNRDEALEWLDLAQRRRINAEWIWAQEHALDALRGDPRFEEIVDRARAEIARMRQIVLEDEARAGRPVT